MSRCPSTEQLRQLLTDALPAADAKVVEAHAVVCISCQQILERLAAADPLPPRTPQPPADPSHDEAYLRRLEASPPWAGPTSLYEPLASRDAFSSEAGRHRRSHQGAPGIANETTSMAADNAAASISTPQVAGYEILGLLGAGGMGTVYKARHLQLNRLVALKMVLAGRHARPTELLRFRIEAEAVAALAHPNIVPVHDVGEADGCPYLALEYVDGGTLAQRLKAGPFTSRQAAELVRVLATAMDYAHRRGVIHRDLKPANVLLTAENLPKITDFGLAKRLGATGGQTATGEVFGTPCYMAPEQAMGQVREIGPATDVYALGAILYNLLTGRPPFEGATPLETLVHVTSNEPVPPSRLRPGVPRDLETICLKCLAKEPAKRYATAEALAEDLRRFLEDRPIMARPAGSLERAWRWVRRQPALASLLLVSVLSVLAVVGFTVGSWYHVQLRQAHDQLQQAFAAETAAQYFRQILLAHNEWKDNHAVEAEALLDALPAGSARHWEWHYLKRLCHADLLTLTGHKATVQCVSYSPDGKYLASASPDKTVKIWNAATGQLLVTLTGHANFVYSVAFSPDSKYLASGSGQGSIRVWDVATWQERFRLKVDQKVYSRYAKGTNIISSLAFSEAGPYLAGAYEDQRIRIWNTDTQELAGVLEGHQGDVTSLAWLDGGPRLVSASTDRTVRLWDTSTGQVLRTLEGHTQAVTSLAFAGHTEHLATGSEDQTVRLWDLRTGQQVQVFEGHTAAVLGVAFSPDGKRLASASHDDSVQVWDMAQRRLEFRLRGHGKHVHSVAFRPDGQQLATATHLGTVRLWDAVNRPEARILKPAKPAGEVHGVTASPTGPWLASACDDGAVRVWDAVRGELRHTLQGHQARVNGVAYSPDGQYLASASADRTVRLWQAANGRPVRTLEDHTAEVWSVAFSPDGTWLASASGQERPSPANAGDNTIRLWEVATGRLIYRLSGHTGKVSGIAFSPDGRWLASASWDHTLRLWSCSSGQQVRVIDGDQWDGSEERKSTGRIYSVTFSPDGQLLASGSQDQSVHIWDPRSGQHQRAFPGRFTVWSVAFHPNGQRLASGCNDSTIRLWDLKTGVEVFALKGHTQAVNGVTFSSDGCLLASCAADHTIRVWDATPVEQKPAPRAQTPER